MLEALSSLAKHRMVYYRLIIWSIALCLAEEKTELAQVALDVNKNNSLQIFGSIAFKFFAV